MGNSASSLPYTIGAEVDGGCREVRGGWALHEGSQKSNGTAVTVFQAHKPALGGKLEPALAHFSRCRTMMHPHILKVLATLDTDYPDGSTASTSTGKMTGDILIVTEHAMPLRTWLQQQAPRSSNSGNHHQADELAWGLSNVIEAVHFLHTTAQLAHGNVSVDAIYVTRAGDYKLADFRLATPMPLSQHFVQWNSKCCPQNYQSPERLNRDWNAINGAAIHTMDSYSLGILIKEVYSLAGMGGVPDKLQKAVQRLQTANIKMRPRVGPLLKCPIFQNPYSTLQEFLNGIATKTSDEKLVFYQSLHHATKFSLLHKGLATQKVWPALLQTIAPGGGTSSVASPNAVTLQDSQRREVLAVLPVLFQIMEEFLVHDQEEFQRLVTPVIEKMFAISDRGIRGALLTKVSLLEKQLTPAKLNSAVFEPMCSGFSDSAAQLRELTLKSTIVLVPHLSPANLEKLVRYLVRLQGDAESSIRTNTVIFIGKIASHLSDTSRQRLILPAFTRAMKDPFTPCRLAALRAVLHCRVYFRPKDVAAKVLPCVVPHLMDSVQEVRKEAFAVVDEFMIVLRAESQTMALQEKSNPQPQQQAPNDPQQQNGYSTFQGTTQQQSQQQAAPSSGNYLSGFSSWATSAITSSAKANDTNVSQPTHNAMGPGGNSSMSSLSQQPQQASSSSTRPLNNTASMMTPMVNSTQTSMASMTMGHQAPMMGMSNMNSGGDDSGGWSDEDDDIALEEAEDPFANIGKGNNSGMAKSHLLNHGGTTTNSHNLLDPFSSSAFDVKPAKSIRGLSAGKKLVLPSTSKVTKSTTATITTKKLSLAERKAQRTAAAPVKKLTTQEDLTDGWDDF